MPVSAKAILSTPSFSNGKQVISNIWWPPEIKGVVVGGIGVSVGGSASPSFLS